jgi:SnoaL-like domain
MSDVSPISPERVEQMVDRAEIIEVCCRMHRYVDRKLWHRFSEVFADEVSIPTRDEFQSVHPGESVQGNDRPLGDLAAGMALMMDGLTTQHIVSGHHVDLDGDTAICYANSYNMHIGSPQIAENRVVHANAYEFELARTRAGWRIRALRATPIWAQGNERITS